MMAGLIAVTSVHGISFYGPTLTGQGLTLIVITFSIDAVLVLKRFFTRTDYKDQSSLPLANRLSWAMYNITFPIALAITGLYWPGLALFSLNDLKGRDSTRKIVMSLFEHAVNFLACLIDMLITARPVSKQV